jgi:hypothetical protein
MAEDNGLYIGRCIDIHAADELYKIAGLSPSVSASSIDRFADEMNGHWTFPHMRCAKVLQRMTGVNDYRMFHIRDSHIWAAKAIHYLA